MEQTTKSASAAWQWVRRHPIRAIGLLALVGVFELGVAGFGALAHREGWISSLSSRARALFSADDSGDDQTAVWRQAILSQHTLEWASFRVSNPTLGGALAEIDGDIVVASPQGHLSRLSRDYQLSPLDLPIELGLDQLRNSPLMQDPLFQLQNMRVHDLLARRTDGDAWELYATFSRYQNDNCFQFVLARARLQVTSGLLRPSDQGWEDIYIARPGCIRVKDHSWRFIGEQAGGRMQLLNARTMLVTVGDHQFDGFNDQHNAPMDPEWDLGKIIALDLDTRRSEIFASGLRNPQGLAILRDGRIIETEHGPQGGDEINLIRRGSNYGWPLVSYGMNYGYPRRAWAPDPTPGGHGGFTRPIHAFVPSIGIGNVVQPDPLEFPLWGDDDLLINSLRAQTLFHVRLNGDRVAYAEPLPFPGERLRDAIVLADGRVALMSDSGNLILLRNADRHAEGAREFVVRGLDTLPQDDPLPENDPPAVRGQRMFAIACASCHSVNGEPGAGPPLNGVVGRRVGSVSGFPYSQALNGQSRTWTGETLQRFMTDPQQEFPGTTMQPMSVSWIEAPNIVAYLRTTRQ